MFATPLTDAMVDAAIRLLEALRSPMDCKVLGPQTVRKIIYHVLCGERNGALKEMVAKNGRFSNIAKALKIIELDYDKELNIPKLADEANMSVSNFHLNFKAVTSTSPLQYLKCIRLHKARSLIAREGLSVYMAASKVGYESQSQFSREFKRFFGATPLDEATKLRTG